MRAKKVLLKQIDEESGAGKVGVTTKNSPRRNGGFFTPYEKYTHHKDKYTSIAHPIFAYFISQ